MTKPTIKPWMKQPGELHDSRGFPIYPGDLLRTPHFRGARRKQYYMYDVAVMCQGAMRGVAVHNAYKPKSKLPGYLLSQEHASQSTILCGYGGANNEVSYEDRPRVKIVKAPVVEIQEQVDTHEEIGGDE